MKQHPHPMTTRLYSDLLVASCACGTRVIDAHSAEAFAAMFGMELA